MNKSLPTLGMFLLVLAVIWMMNNLVGYLSNPENLVRHTDYSRWITCNSAKCTVHIEYEPMGNDNKVYASSSDNYMIRGEEYCEPERGNITFIQGYGTIGKVCWPNTNLEIRSRN